MRPMPGDNAFVRRRSTDHDVESSVNLASTSSSQMSFFLADESTVDSYLDQPSVAGSQMRDPRKPVVGSGHVLACERDDLRSEQPRSASIRPEMDSGSMYSPLSTVSLPSPTPVPASSTNQHAPLSRPITPITLGTSVTGSLLSGPSSRRNSFVGSISANAISFDDDDHVLETSTVDMVDSGSAPQLVMPSIKMPSRRPFTSTGKSLGRLKVLCAGASKTGKTSLLKSIVQTCEHIVHVDPIVPQAGSRRSTKEAMRPPPRPSRGRHSETTESIYEIFASTKSYPEWWVELGHANSSQRRKSLGDQVLDRNICFVDTPGYSLGASAMETIVPCIEYVESHLSKVYSDSLNELERLNLLGGDGGLQVDVVLYLIQRYMTPVDIEYLKRLSSLTNVIPLLAQSDTMSIDEQNLCKQQILGQLREADISFFSFTTGSALQTGSNAPTVPYAVSSATGSDLDVMDASLLMSPDYVQPLAPSELSVLISHMFSLSGSSWLRHSAAKKYLQWRDESAPSRPRHLYQPLSPGTGALIGRPPLTLARITQHRDYDVNNATRRIELVDWAADLQRSLAQERARQENLACRDHSTWPNECVASGTLVSACRRNAQSPVRRRRRQGGAAKRTSRHQDPLGLLQVLADLKSKGWIALEVLGSLGILGGLAYYLTHQNEPAQTADDWARLWGFDI
ncbi:hypothetical protein PFICI_13002 [Pestalotiopsis fici W106-1]|uniref:Septin-type G domain-containing protein n=1 Tax=Pestalotiopsis fici (strain W106-1 / CGMCC3.15140) TaxID=1229662 RepID=W3WQC7_PESFW|nr:uncharacterized protein PFICI_13002 [Pestalotiopsis fici W106-1]ETS76058.1 hypothetical protein PFICI_13002 [Pestalotiopsis fici W106-1]